MEKFKCKRLYYRLTAFVAGNFQDASELVTIDKTVICQAVNYLIKSQKETGAFLEEGQSFSKAMMVRQTLILN